MYYLVWFLKTWNTYCGTFGYRTTAGLFQVYFTVYIHNGTFPLKYALRDTLGISNGSFVMKRIFTLTVISLESVRNAFSADVCEWFLVLDWIIHRRVPWEQNIRYIYLPSLQLSIMMWLFEQWIIFKNLQLILLFLNIWTLIFYCFRLKNVINIFWDFRTIVVLLLFLSKLLIFIFNKAYYQELYILII
jgi:hypothetical protein